MRSFKTHPRPKDFAQALATLQKQALQKQALQGPMHYHCIPLERSINHFCFIRIPVL